MRDKYSRIIIMQLVLHNLVPKLYTKNGHFRLISQLIITPKIRNQLLSKIYQSEPLAWLNKIQGGHTHRNIAKIALFLFDRQNSNFYYIKTNIFSKKTY